MLIGLLCTQLALAERLPPPPRAVNMSLVAQGIRPGVKLGMDIPLLRQQHRSDRRPEGRKLTQRDMSVEPAVSVWHHWGNHTPITAGAQLFYRRGKESGWQRELFVGQGITYAINAGITYSFDQSGTLQGSRLAGRWMSATQVGFGLGRDRSDTDMAWHVRPTLMVWAPYNDTIAPVFLLEMGVRR